MKRINICPGFVLLWVLYLVAGVAPRAVAQLQTAQSRAGDWPNYGNDPGGMRFSSLRQINRNNVYKLKAAWVFHTGDISDGHGRPRSGFETTPLFVDETL